MQWPAEEDGRAIGPILVTGGTGTLGRLVVARLQNAGCAVRVLSRHQAADGSDGVEYVTGDLGSGEGVDAAVSGVRTVVHCAGSAKGDDDKARHLVSVASRAGVSHLVYISVVGADRVPVVSRADRAMFGYFAAKLAAERIISESGVPYTILRATQFHDLILTMAQAMAKLPVIPTLSGVRFQPVDAGDVADRLVELAFARPEGLVDDLGGPRIYDMAHLLRDCLRASRKRRLVVPLRQPGKAAAAYRDGANLAPDHAVGKRTWEDFLAERVGLI
ncbi:NAD(P)H-binding protein [Phytoactinopolyspora alkaliphila]|uniref:NAD(P)H-binding protein n=1 Tax=Phytoactinopolyspora alkaliphila TaxID=1783498 RepID=A0A6N9YLL5_9ACTN|nr:NAD(P)H-binding protein [Phytoactinopolyspora alkaliphila]NED95916.1 NAD(P)H-binding protein [Phytoactinopolyspora alkaliphila]